MTIVDQETKLIRVEGITNGLLSGQKEVGLNSVI